MYFQIYLNNNSSGEDITFLKNFCSSFNINVETLHTNLLTQPNSLNKFIKNKATNLTNIILVWSLENNEASFTLIREFCKANLLNYIFLYDNIDGFFKISNNHQKTQQNNLSAQLLKQQHTKIIELHSNLEKYKSNKTEPRTKLESLAQRHLLEL